jgi:GT2 family glycosyltransferase
LDISVVIPTRNRAQKLRRTLDGLCAQSVPAAAFEVVVVDNASSDDTRATVGGYLDRAAHWKYLREPKPGAAAARNSGIRASQGEIVLFLDDDVVPDPRLVEEHGKSHREQAAVVLGSVRFPWHGTGTAFRRTLSQHPELLQSFRFPDPASVPFQHFYTCNLSLPRSFLSRSGTFDEDFQGSGFEDTDLGYRIARAGFRMVFNPRASAVHDCWLSFPDFAEKQRRNGRELHLLLKKHPELGDVFLPAAASRRRKLAALVGGAASVLGTCFERPAARLSFLVLPLLARFCWLNLQYRFWAGLQEAERSPGA